MSAGRFAVIALAVVAVVVAIGVSRGGKDDGGTTGSATTSAVAGKPPPGALVVDFAYSPEKEALLAPLLKSFNGRREQVGGRTVFVRGEVVASGTAEQKIARSTLKPALWSPASSLWGRLLTYEADKPWVPDTSPSLVRTPLVIAMWEPLARALGYPRKKVGFEQVLDLATSGEGWAKYGKPQYGQFKLGHTNPDFSTSGLSAVAAEYYAATGKREGLTVADVEADRTRRRIRSIERSIVHYGDTTLFFSDQLKRYGPAYASAVAMEEATLIDFNRTRKGQDKLIGVYPSEGTFFSDNPLIVLDAPWVTPEVKQAAAKVRDFLAGAVTPQVAADAGFRPGDPAKAPVSPVDASNGVDPKQPTRVLSLPQPDVLARVKKAWREDRKPANVVLAVDTSGSMGEEDKLGQAKQGLASFFRQLSPADRVGLVTFNDQVFDAVGVAPFARDATQLRAAVRDLLPGGETAWLDATGDAVSKVQALHDPTRINAVVVLTDGEDTSSRQKVQQLTATLDRQARSEGLTVRVYTIAYGKQANQSALEKIAAASGGKAFVGDPKEIEAVYTSISSFF